MLLVPAARAAYFSILSSENNMTALLTFLNTQVYTLSLPLSFFSLSVSLSLFLLLLSLSLSLSPFHCLSSSSLSIMSSPLSHQIHFTFAERQSQGEAAKEKFGVQVLCTHFTAVCKKY